MSRIDPLGECSFKVQVPEPTFKVQISEQWLLVRHKGSGKFSPGTFAGGASIGFTAGVGKDVGASTNTFKFGIRVPSGT